MPRTQPAIGFACGGRRLARVLPRGRARGPRRPDRPEARERAARRRAEVHAVRIEGIRAVKAHLNRIVGRLPAEGSVVITRNGRPCAVLMPVSEDTDLEAVALATSKRLWVLYDRARARADREGWTPLDAVAKRPRASRHRRHRP